MAVGQVMRPVERRAYDLLHRGALAMARTEQAGMRIDLDYCRMQDRRLQKKMILLQRRLEGTELGKLWRMEFGARMALGKNEQLAHVLYGKMGRDPAVRTKTGKGATTWEALDRLDVPGLEIVRDWRRLQKAHGTYIVNLLREVCDDGLFRPSFHLNTVTTYRGSAELFQTIPRRDPEQGRTVRQAFRAREGRRIIEPDFGGMEVRTGCCIHQDPNMVKYYTKGGDMHKDAACTLFLTDLPQVTKQMKDVAKNGWVFPEFYGSWYRNCAPAIWRRVTTDLDVDGSLLIRLADGTPLLEHLKARGIGTLAKFMAHAEKAEAALWGDQFPGYAKWREGQWRRYLKQGYVDMVTGFRCSGVMNRKDVTNYPIQGPAFHCLLQTVIWMWEEIDRQGLEALIIGQIHDAAPTDAPAAESDAVLDTFFRLALERLPAEWRWVTVPLEVEADATPIGGSWHEKTAASRAPDPCPCGGRWQRERGTRDAPEVPECLNCGADQLTF